MSNTLDRRPLESFEGFEAGRQVKLGAAIEDARDCMTFTSAEGIREILKEHGYAGTVDQVLTRDSARFAVTIPEGTRGIIEGIETEGQWGTVVFVWKTPKSGKVTACMVQVTPGQMVNHRGAPPLPGEAIKTSTEGSSQSTTETSEEQRTMFQTLTSTPPKASAPTLPTFPAGSMDALFAAIVDMRVGARIEALEAELATRTGSGSVRVRINDLPETQLEGTAHRMLPEALRWASSKRRNGMRFNVALVGDAGTGKSTLAEQVAQSLGLRFDFLNCSGGVAESRLFGRMTPDLSTGAERYTESIMVDYFRNGGVFLLDEMDGLDANVLTAANGFLESRRWTAPNGETIERHPDCIFFGAMNTHGTGASRLYTGRTQLDAASLDRWAILEVDYDAELERALCSQAEIVERFHAIRAQVRKLGLRRWVTGRMIERAEVMHVCHGAPIAAAVRAQLNGWSDADLKACGVA